MVHSVYGGGRRGLGGVGVFLPLDFVNLLRYIVLSRAGADFFSGLGGGTDLVNQSNYSRAAEKEFRHRKCTGSTFSTWPCECAKITLAFLATLGCFGGIHC